MLKSLLTFSLFILLIGGGAVWFIESNTTSDVVARGGMNSTGASWKHQVKVKYYGFKIRTKAWWSKTRAQIKRIMPGQEPLKEVEIIRWQDHNGVWHFEEAKPSAPPAQ